MARHFKKTNEFASIMGVGGWDNDFDWEALFLDSPPASRLLLVPDDPQDLLPCATTGQENNLSRSLSLSSLGNSLGTTTQEVASSQVQKEGTNQGDAFGLSFDFDIPDPTPVSEMVWHTPNSSWMQTTEPGRVGIIRANSSRDDSDKKRSASACLPSQPKKCKSVATSEPDDDSLLSELMSNLRKLVQEWESERQNYQNVSTGSNPNSMDLSLPSIALLDRIKEAGCLVVDAIKQDYWKHQPRLASNTASRRTKDSVTKDQEDRWSDFRPFLEDVRNLTAGPPSYVHAIEMLVSEWRGLPKMETSDARQAVARKYVEKRTTGTPRGTHPQGITLHPIEPWHILVKDNGGRKTLATHVFRLKCWDYKVNGDTEQAANIARQTRKGLRDTEQAAHIVRQTRKTLRRIFPHVDETELGKVLRGMSKKEAEGRLVPLEDYYYGVDGRGPSFAAVSDDSLDGMLHDTINRLSPSGHFPVTDVLDFLLICTDDLKAEFKGKIDTGIIEDFKDKIKKAGSFASGYEEHHSVAQSLQGALLKDFARLRTDCFAKLLAASTKKPTEV